MLVIAALAVVIAVGAYAVTRGRTSPVKADGVERPVGSLTSPDIQSQYISINGDTQYHIVQTFIDASTTIVSFQNPFGTSATATVDMARLEITSPATSTFTVSCGASATPTANPSYAIISSGAVNTSTIGMVVNNLTAALGGVADGGTVHIVELTPTYPYFVCNVTANVSAAFTQQTNTFDGKATVRIWRTR